MNNMFQLVKKQNKNLRPYDVNYDILRRHLVNVRVDKPVLCLKQSLIYQPIVISNDGLIRCILEPLRDLGSKEFKML